MERRIQVTFDAADPHTLARWWADLLGYQVQDTHDFVTKLLGDGVVTQADVVRIDGRLAFADATAANDPRGAGPRLYFQRVPEPKTAKNRVHLDIPVDPGQLDDARSWLRQRAVRLKCHAVIGDAVGDDALRFGIVTSLPDWAFWGVAIGSPLLNAAVTIVGQRVSRRGDRELEIRSRREEVMRTLRWAAELAVSDEVHKARLGNQELKALLGSDMLNSADRDFIFAALDAALEEPVQAIELAGDDVEVVAATTGLSDDGEVLIPSEEES